VYSAELHRRRKITVAVIPISKTVSPATPARSSRRIIDLPEASFGTASSRARARGRCSVRRNRYCAVQKSPVARADCPGRPHLRALAPPSLGYEGLAVNALASLLV
jgi:hypothetical protein